MHYHVISVNNKRGVNDVYQVNWAYYRQSCMRTDKRNIDYRRRVSGGSTYTEINLDGAPGVLFGVKETPEQIMEMIENAKN